MIDQVGSGATRHYLRVQDSESKTASSRDPHVLRQPGIIHQATSARASGVAAKRAAFANGVRHVAD